MRTFLLAITTLLLCGNLAVASAPMRPYSGIGVLQLSEPAPPGAITLYDDPGIERCCTILPKGISQLNGWLFGTGQPPALLVTARKGEWIEVEHDDAGRTGWIRQRRNWQFLPWEQYLQGRQVRFLRNSPKNRMLLATEPGDERGEQLTARQPLQVVQAKGDWLYVQLERGYTGWIRWRDSDGRLLIGFDSETSK